MKDYYEPQEDSQMLLDVLTEELVEVSRSLEVGVGSGILSEEILKHSKKHIGVDINPFAIEETKSRLERFGSDSFSIKKSNLFEKIRGKFDLIVFNPPYLPARKDDPDNFITKAIIGGKKGYEIILKFLSDLPKYLENNGVCYLLFTKLSCPEIILENMDEMLLDYSKVAEKSIMFENIYVYKIKKSEILKNLESEKVKDLIYFSKGKRGKIFIGKVGRRKVAVKILNNLNTPNAIVKEAKNLEFVNSFGVGPKFRSFNSDFNYLVYNFSRGVIMEKYYLDASLDEFKEVILKCMEKCYLMDINNFEKQEMKNPYKHIIVNPLNLDVSFIDFERGVMKNNSGNLTQFIQYLTRSKLSKHLLSKGIEFNKEKLLEFSKIYKNKKSEEMFKKIKKEIIEKF